MEGFVHLRVLRPQHLRAYLLDCRAESLRVVVVLSRTTTTTMGYSRRARGRLARRREPRRDWFSARRRVWRRRRPFPRASGRRPWGSGRRRSSPRGWRRPGRRATTPRASARASRRRATVCRRARPWRARRRPRPHRNARGRGERTGGFRAPPPRTARRAPRKPPPPGGASRPPGLTTRRSTRRCRKENSTAARANEARTTLARRRLSLAPRDECDAERSRAVSCARETTTRTSEPTKRRETHNDAIHIPAHCGARFARGRFRYSKSDAPQAR